MIDALLYSCRDAIRGAGLGYDKRTCEITPLGRPPANSGDVFLGVHQGPVRSDSDNCLMEYYGFFVTLTMRLGNVPLDRLGTQLIAKEAAKEIGFNRRADQLRAFLHMNSGVLQDANQKLITMHPEANVVYGFCEPARYLGMDEVQFVGGEWFSADPAQSSPYDGIKATLTFDGCRRMQPIAQYV